MCHDDVCARATPKLCPTTTYYCCLHAPTHTYLRYGSPRTPKLPERLLSGHWNSDARGRGGGTRGKQDANSCKTKRCQQEHPQATPSAAQVNPRFRRHERRRVVVHQAPIANVEPAEKCGNTPHLHVAVVGIVLHRHGVHTAIAGVYGSWGEVGTTQAKGAVGLEACTSPPPPPTPKYTSTCTQHV